MDEQRLGEAIGRSMSEATARMMPMMADATRQAVLAAQTGVYVEVPAEEMALRLAERARKLRHQAEEVAAEPVDPMEGVPPHMRAQFAVEVKNKASLSAADEAARKAVLEQLEQIQAQERKRRRARVEALRVEAERLDFTAAHLPKDQVLRLDQRELDDLLFRDRDAASTGFVY